MYPKLKPLSLKSVNRSYSDESCTRDNWNGQNPYCTFSATHSKTLYVPCMKIKLNKPIYVGYFPQIMLFFLNHQSLHCLVKKYWSISLNMTMNIKAFFVPLGLLFLLFILEANACAFPDGNHKPQAWCCAVEMDKNGFCKRYKKCDLDE